MANQRKNTPSSRRRQPARRSRTRQTKRGFNWNFLPKKAEFKPDAEGSGALKLLHMTRQQRLRLLKWVLYAAVIVLSLVIQDVIMSRVSLFGATTDLAVCAILMITVIEGTEVGSLFVLIASTLYYFSGSSPGPYTVILLTGLGVGTTLFRQAFLHRSAGSIVLCSGFALMLYELGTFVVGIFQGLTHWGRLGVFLFTGIFSCIVLIPLYPLIHKIGLIGGNTWKE